MLLNKICYNCVDKNLYNKNDIEKRWHTFETEDIRKVWYSIREDGLVISTNKRTYQEKIVKPVLSGSVLIVRINRKVFKVKQLVAKYFCDDYYDGCCIIHKDDNPYNCEIENLIICDRQKSGKLTGYKANRDKQIIFNNKKYNSVKEFCEKNYIGIRTYYDYKQKRYKNSIIKEMHEKYMHIFERYAKVYQAVRPLV